MFKPNIKKMIDKKNQLPPVPPIFEKDKLIDNINNELVNLKSGNYLVKLIDLKNGRRSWISYEYYLDTIYDRKKNKQGIRRIDHQIVYQSIIALIILKQYDEEDLLFFPPKRKPKVKQSIKTNTKLTLHNR